MVFDDFDDFVDYIQNKSDINIILVRIGTNFAELNIPPSHPIGDHLPEYEGLGTRNPAGNRAGHVTWPSGSQIGNCGCS